MDQSTNNKRVMLQVAYGKTCPALGALLFAWQKNSVWVVRKVRTDILLADLVCFEPQSLPRSAHLKIFLIFVILMTLFQVCVYILNLFIYIIFFTSASSLLPSSFIIIYFLAPDREDDFLSKAPVFHCFLVFRRIGEYSSLDLFYQFCQAHQ